MSNISKIICVDLDGSLIYTDSTLEIFFTAIRNHILVLFYTLLWLLKGGRPYCKQQLIQCVDLSAFRFPINQTLLKWLKQQKSEGAFLYLVTGTDQAVADLVAKQLGIFNGVYGSNGVRNLTGKAKRDFLDKKFGQSSYSYVGNSRTDLFVFAHAKEAIVVNNQINFINKVKALAPVVAVFKGSENNFSQLGRAFRLHQSAKNILIFLPLLLSHQVTNFSLTFLTLIGFVSFSLIAFSVYLLNDLLDITHDRHHFNKCNRPFASGQLSLLLGLLSMMLCLIIGFLIAIVLLPAIFVLTLFFYYVCTLLYSFKLKKLLLIDVFALGVLYTVRVLAGMTIMGSVGYSAWLLLFSFFLFMSLAFMKRYSETMFLKNEKEIIFGRAYQKIHKLEIKIFGIVSGFSSVLIFALYLQSERPLQFYHHREILYLICPFLLYWVLRAWLITAEGKMYDDPVQFALQDRCTYWILFIISIIAAAAIW